MRPSTGTFSPGRMRTRSPTTSASSATSSSVPSARDAPRGLRREPEQLPDRKAGAAASRELQPFAQQHQRDDRRGHFEVHADHAVRIAHLRGKESGRECREQAEDEGDQHAEPDQACTC